MDEGRKRTPEIFRRKYEAYQIAKESGKIKAKEETYKKLQNMGIIILPNLLEKMESGSKDLISMFRYLCDPKDLKSAADCKKWWNANKEKHQDLLDYE